MKIPALKVNQWLSEWDKINFDEAQHKAEPQHYFYVFSIKASTLRALSGIQRREANPNTRRDEIGIQRKHDKKRSKEIKMFLKHGYPWSSLTPTKQADPEFADMQKPGWIPTAVVINILRQDDQRRGKKVDSNDLIVIQPSERISNLELPASFNDSQEWAAQELPPIEVIDGQHRLWAFDQKDEIDFEIPVVAFHGLDISWQAYLFWVINIKPKKIDASLAFDMYPLLRNEDWLEKGEEHIVYRETRAQELVEILWSYPESPWYKRIEMLGGKRDFVSQNAWVRSLISTFIKRWQKTSGRPGGLFGSQMRYNEEVLNWSRSQQAAFLVYIWQCLAESLKNVNEPQNNWTEKIRKSEAQLENIGLDVAFAGKNSLLNTDQGVRAYLHLVNDIFYELSEEFSLSQWEEVNDIDDNDPLVAVKANIEELKMQSFASRLNELSQQIAQYDWRTSSEPSLTSDEQKMKKRFRGSGGYKELRHDVLTHIASQEGRFQEVATNLLEAMEK